MAQNHQLAAFLFVNKDAQSGSLSHSENEASSINRQAQRWVARTTRRRKIVALQTQSTSTRKIAHLGWQRREPDTEDEVTSGILNAEPAKTDATPRNQLPLYSANFSDGDGVDPFASTPVRMNKEVHGFLQYYISYSILTAFKGEVVREEHLLQMPGPLPAAIVQRSLKNETHMYALLTATAAHMNRIAPAGQKVDNKYMAAAIRSLRMFLASLDTKKRIDPQFVLDVLFLSNAERCRGNDEAALMHLRVLRQLTKLLDMSFSSDRYVYQMVCDTDVFISVETATRPLFALSWDPGVISESRKAVIGYELDQALSQPRVHIRQAFMGTAAASQSVNFKQRMGIGFIDALAAGIFSTNLHAIISDLVQTIDIAMYSSICPSATEADAVWVHRKTTALAHRLSSLGDIRKSALDDNNLAGTLESHIASLTPSQEECCRLALIILLTYIPSTVANRSLTKNAVRLQLAISALAGLSWGSRIADEMLLWVLVTGLVIVLDRPEEEWFTSRVLRVTSELGIHDLTGLRDFMWRFLYRPHTSYEECLSRLAAALRPECDIGQLLAARLHPDGLISQPWVIEEISDNETM
jgi:Fungal specific transcription factor domain